MSKENAFEMNCESCDEEFKVKTETKGISPTNCPFCGSDEINIVNQADSVYLSPDAEDEEVEPEED